MPAKRKTGGGGGRGKRPRQSSPDVENSEEKVLAGQQTEEKDAPMAPRMAEEDSNKMVPMDGEADADGEADDDKMDATHDVDAEGEREEVAHSEVGEQQLQDTSHEPVPEGDEDHEGDVVRPISSTRGRGRGRGRRTRGVVPASTRSSPRKASQQTQAQHISKPPNRRGRKAARARERGIVTSNSPPADPPATGAGEEDGAKKEESTGNDENEGEEGREEAKAEVANHESPSQPILAPQSHQAPQPSHQIHGADQSVHAPAEPFSPQTSAYYPNYPPQATPFPYTYGAPPSSTATSNAPDGRPYLALRPDDAQPAYSTSFATTVGTAGNESNSASSSFNVPYPSSTAHAHPLDVSAPQGNPFPPSAPMPVPAYSENVYRVTVSGDEDEDDQDHEQSAGVQAPPPKKKAQLAAAKGGGRTGRGDHVACHFCRGMSSIVLVVLLFCHTSEVHLPFHRFLLHQLST